MSWIRTITYDEATGKLKELYDRIKGPDVNIDNIMLAHSLRPHTMEGHMALYKHVLHHASNTLPTSYLEATGLYVSILNDCEYCIEHHFAGLARLLKDDDRATGIRRALEHDDPASAFEGKELAGLLYARKLTLHPVTVESGDVESLRNAAFDDGEILEINQVISYFAYANRTVLGLGIDTEGDILGLSPSDDVNNWSHR
jgi:uncharacterized peroxidase-related enzyme